MVTTNAAVTKKGHLELSMVVVIGRDAGNLTIPIPLGTVIGKRMEMPKRMHQSEGAEEVSGEATSRSLTDVKGLGGTEQKGAGEMTIPRVKAPGRQRCVIDEHSCASMRSWFLEIVPANVQVLALAVHFIRALRTRV